MTRIRGLARTSAWLSGTIECDDVVAGVTDPATSGREADAVFDRQLDVAGLVHQLLELVVVDSLQSCRCWHAAIVGAGSAS